MSQPGSVTQYLQDLASGDGDALEQISFSCRGIFVRDMFPPRGVRADFKPVARYTIAGNALDKHMTNRIAGDVVR